MRILNGGCCQVRVHWREVYKLQAIMGAVVDLIAQGNLEQSKEEHADLIDESYVSEVAPRRFEQAARNVLTVALSRANQASKYSLNSGKGSL